MKKILILTYYWPPKGGVGVQRWLKLSKYLKDDFKVSIFTPKGGEYSFLDTTLNSEIPIGIEELRLKIFEPQVLLNFFFKKQVSQDVLISKNPSILNKLLIWIRANFFIPDTRALWINKSVKFLNNYLMSHKVDCIISTGPPHSMHMIALKLIQKNNIKWIADFRDPWTEIEYFEQLPLTSCARNKHFRLEQKVLKTANLVLSVSQSWAHNLLSKGAKSVHVVHNGYDLSDYDFNKKKSNLDFTVGHFGLYNQLRDHSFFWDVINDLTTNIADFRANLKLLFVGQIYCGFLDIMNQKSLADKIQFISNAPHSNAIKTMMNCDVLLVTQSDTSDANGRLPAKFFEYLATRKPIIGIGRKNSDLDHLMKDISYCWFVEFNNSKLLYETLSLIYNQRTSEIIYNDDISVFSRQNQANYIMQLINNL